MESTPKAILKVEIPIERYRLLKRIKPPVAGDVLELDQGFASEDGTAMVLAYHRSTDGEYDYEAEVYETEIE